MRTQFNTNIYELQLNNGIDFGVSKLNNILTDNGCQLIPLAPYHHKQNGFVEWANGLVTQCSRAMLIDSCLPKELWSESITIVVHIINQSSTTANPEHSSAYYHFMVTIQCPISPRLDWLKAFGATAYVHIPPETR